MEKVLLFSNCVVFCLCCDDRILTKAYNFDDTQKVVTLGNNFLYNTMIKNQKYKTNWNFFADSFFKLYYQESGKRLFDISVKLTYTFHYKSARLLYLHEIRRKVKTFKLAFLDTGKTPELWYDISVGPLFHHYIIICSIWFCMEINVKTPKYKKFCPIFDCRNVWCKQYFK